MKIGIIVRKLNMRGGVGRQALSLAFELKRLGQEIKVYTFLYNNPFPELGEGLDVFALHPSEHLATRGNFGIFKEDRMARALAWHIDPGLDILNPHDNIANHVAYHFKKNIKNIPSVWQMNEFPTMRWPLSLLGWDEDAEFHDIPKKALLARKLSIMAKTIYENKFIKKQDGITIFDSFHRDMLEKYSGRDAVIVQSGVDQERFPFILREAPSPREELRILSAGNLISYRRFEDIIAALPSLLASGLNPFLTILGDSTPDKKYLEKLKELAQRMGVEKRVSFYGDYGYEVWHEYLKKSHIFVFPHLQSQSLTAYESILAGLPTIVAAMPGTYETLQHREAAYIVKPKSPAEISSGIKEITSNPELYQKLSKEGSDFIRKNFSWERYGREMLEVFKRHYKK